MAVAAQLADFLTPRLGKGSGMMALPDMYCLFNRARGTELISPDDLLSAAKLFPAIGARLSFRQFPSGVLVVQSSAHLDDQVSRSRSQHGFVTGSCSRPALSVLLSATLAT